MAPKPSSRDSKGKPTSKSSTSKASSKPSSKPRKPRVPNPKDQVRTKRANAGSAKKKRRTYTDKELGIPTLNMITPAGVQKPKGKKKGKVFVDDQESMMTILAIVNADKEGQIESKMMKARQMEEIREARRKEAEVRQAEKKSKLEDVKDSLRKHKLRKSDTNVLDAADVNAQAPPTKRNKKRVSFG